MEATDKRNKHLRISNADVLKYYNFFIVSREQQYIYLILTPLHFTEEKDRMHFIHFV